MPRSTEVQFRGHIRTVIVDFDGGYEPDTNAHVIEWHFEDMTPEQHDALALTDDEEQAIYEQLCQESGED
jgi:hypothetical protein